jgi:hypothetical protein
MFSGEWTHEVKDLGGKKNKAFQGQHLLAHNVPDSHVRFERGTWFVSDACGVVVDDQLNGKRPFVLARSLFLGSGAHAAHWTGDNGATWRDLKYSIVGVINSGLFGVPMVGADICGFNFRATEELCLRWTQVRWVFPYHSAESSGLFSSYLR